jgi:tryptophan synthase alpha chain
VKSLASIFERGDLAFISYVMAGDPDLETTRALLAALSEAGAAAIELGIPYGDPLADGPSIAAAGMRALAEGTTLRDVLSLVREVSASTVPIVLFTYYNPVYQYGIGRFAREAARAGAAGAIVPDVALEEGEELRSALLDQGLEMPLLVAPSTNRGRAARITAQSTGFVYVVSRLGVTGAGDAPDLSPLRAQIAMLREATGMPLAVGFGISKAEQLRAMRGVADGVVVGSAIIDAYAGARGEEAASKVSVFVKELLSAG